jgi:hypothetical protein
LRYIEAHSLPLKTDLKIDYKNQCNEMRLLLENSTSSENQKTIDRNL